MTLPNEMYCDATRHNKSYLFCKLPFSFSLSLSISHRASSGPSEVFDAISVIHTLNHMSTWVSTNNSRCALTVQ